MHEVMIAAIRTHPTRNPSMNKQVGGGEGRSPSPHLVEGEVAGVRGEVGEVTICTLLHSWSSGFQLYTVLPRQQNCMLVCNENVWNLELRQLLYTIEKPSAQ